MIIAHKILKIVEPSIMGRPKKAAILTPPYTLLAIPPAMKTILLVTAMVPMIPQIMLVKKAPIMAFWTKVYSKISINKPLQIFFV